MLSRASELVKRGFYISVLSFVLSFLWQPLSVHAQDAQPLKWTSQEGKVVTGQFLRMEGKSIAIKLPTGKEVTVKLSSLSLQSHLQALKLAKPEAFSKELIKMPEKVEAPELSAQLTVESIAGSPFGENPSIDDFLKTAISQWKRGNTFVSWQMLPKKLRKDLGAQIIKNMEAIGPSGRQQLSKSLGLLGKIASEKRDWILDPQGSKLAFLGDAVGNSPEKWPHLVGFLKRISEPSLWKDEHFKPEKIEYWLASLTVVMATAKELQPEQDNITYNVISQSADGAEVEIVVADMQPQKVYFQKFDNLWIVPDEMNRIRASLDAEAETAAGARSLTLMSAGMGMIAPMLTKLDQAKTREEFDKVIASSPMERMMGGGSGGSGGGAASGGGMSGSIKLTSLPSLLTGIPFGLPGFPTALPSK